MPTLPQPLATILDNPAAHIGGTDATIDLNLGRTLLTFGGGLPYGPVLRSLSPINHG